MPQSHLTLQWIINEQDRILAAANITIASMLLILGAIIIYSVFIQKAKFTRVTDIKVMLFGAWLQSCGVALHQLYFGVYRMFKDSADYNYISQWLQTYESLQLIPLSFLLTGTILIVAPAWYLVQPPILRKNLRWRRRQYFIAAALSVGLFWFVYIRIWGL